MPICIYADYDRDAKPFPDLLYNVNRSTPHFNSRVHSDPTAQFTSLPVLQYYTAYQLFPRFPPSHLPQHSKFPSFTATPEYIPRNNFIHAPSLQAAHPKTLLMRKFIYTMSHTTPTVMEPPKPSKPASQTSPCTGFNHPSYCIRRWFAIPVIP